MNTTIDIKKKEINKFLKLNNVIKTNLGEIELNIAEKSEGGNAYVYAGTFSDRKVAVKILAEIFVKSEDKQSEKMRRFIQEFRNLILLDNKQYIVPIYFFDSIEINGNLYPYYAMEYYSDTLASWRKRIGEISKEDVFNFFEQLLEAVKNLHEQGIIHRDLKPQNILFLENTHEFVIADFGIASFDETLHKVDVHTKKGDRLGNRGFSSPEQDINGTKPHQRMDIFAIGQIITWLVTGTIAVGERIRLTESDPSLYKLDNIVGKMLRSNPEERFQSINEIQNDMKAILTEETYRENELYKHTGLIKNLQDFRETLYRSIGGISGIILIDNPNEIDNLINKVNEKLVLDKNIDLWWTQGNSNYYIKKNIERISNSCWVVDGTEMNIKKSGYILVLIN